MFAGIRKQALLVAGLIGVFFLVGSSNGVASSLSPRGTKVEQHVAAENSNLWERTVERLGREGALIFAEPVHEEATARIYNCTDSCNDVDVAIEWAGQYVIAGIRWNDDPPFRLSPGEGQHTTCKTAETIRFTTQPECWYQLFKAAKKSAQRGDVPSAALHSPLLARSHFGDLQFFHAMASQDGETAAETQRRILLWMEFTWRVASGEFHGDTPLASVNIDGLHQFFGQSGWTVQDLFTSGNPSLRTRIPDVAFGSLLHAIEDSFAEGHVQREETSPGNCSATLPLPAPPKVLEFHSYAHQDEKKHKEADARAALQEQLTHAVNSVTVGRQLVEYLDNKASWPSVQPYFACVFAVSDPATKATAGTEFAAE